MFDILFILFMYNASTRGSTSSSIATGVFIKKRPADEMNCPRPAPPIFNVEEPAAARGSGKIIKNAQTFQILSGILTYISIEIGGPWGST